MTLNLDVTSSISSVPSRAASPVTLGSKQTYTAIILAGKRNGNDPVASIFGHKYKALVPLVGRPMIAYAVDALRAANSVGDIHVVFDGEEELFASCAKLKTELDAANVKVVATATSICESIVKAIHETGNQFPYLVTTADHALLIPEVVDYFCERAEKLLDFGVGFVEEKHIKAMHPESKRTYLPFQDTKLSGANLFAFNTPNSVKVLEFWKSVENERKRPWKLFKAFGFTNLVGLMLRRFSVKSAFERASRVLGVDAEAVKLPYAEAAIDVDSARDYMQVTKILENRAEEAFRAANPANPR